MEPEIVILEEHFPPKPTLPAEENPLNKSIISLLLFAVTYYMLFDQKLQSLLILIVVLFIHEMGHFLAMKKFNYKDVKMFFIPFLGALVTGENHKISQRERVLISLAGPVPGIFIGMVFYYYGKQNGSDILIQAGNIFVFLNLFNLLPLTPLDGGNVVETMFLQSSKILKIVFLAISLLIITFIAFYLDSYFLLLLPFFIGLRIVSQNKVNKIQKQLEEEKIDYAKSYDDLTDREYWLIRAKVVTAFTDLNKIPADVYRFSKLEHKVIERVKSTLSIKVIQDMGILYKIGVILLCSLCFILPIVLSLLMYEF